MELIKVITNNNKNETISNNHGRKTKNFAIFVLFNALFCARLIKFFYRFSLYPDILHYGRDTYIPICKNFDIREM